MQTLDGETYIEQPIVFEVRENDHELYDVKRSICSLKQSSRR